jgi:hypothetical protein
MKCTRKKFEMKRNREKKGIKKLLYVNLISAHLAMDDVELGKQKRRNSECTVHEPGFRGSEVLHVCSG